MAESGLKCLKLPKIHLNDMPEKPETPKFLHDQPEMPKNLPDQPEMPETPEKPEYGPKRLTLPTSLTLSLKA